MQHISSLPAEIEKYLETLKIGQGRYAGQDLVVLPWQSEFLRGAFSQGGARLERSRGRSCPDRGLLEGLREAINRAGQGQLKDTASEDPNIDKETYVLCSNSVGSSSFDGWPNGGGIGSTQVHFSAVRVWRGLGIDPDGAGVG